MLKNLEHVEHAEHLAHHPHGAEHAEELHEHGGAAAHSKGNQMAALLVAVLAACLAVTEQGARHAEIRVQEQAIFATDAWSQYQAKSTRGTFSKDLSDMIGVLDAGADPVVMDRRKALLQRLKTEQERFEKDPKDGKGAIFERARGFEEARDRSLEQTHSYHNGAAAMELGIVLTTASAIIGSRPLVYMAMGLGIAGIVFALLGFFAPEYGAI